MFNNQTDYKFEKFVNAFTLLLVVVSLFGTIWLAMTDTPPASQINLLQAMLADGSYYPVFSGFILFFPILIVIVIIKTILIFIFNTLFVKDGVKIPYGYKPRW